MQGPHILGHLPAERAYAHCRARREPKKGSPRNIRPPKRGALTPEKKLGHGKNPALGKYRHGH